MHINLNYLQQPKNKRINKLDFIKNNMELDTIIKDFLSFFFLKKRITLWKKFWH